MLLAILDYSGSFAFCVSGASIAASRRMDLFGIFVMTIIAGFGGGCLRDILIGKTPPTVFDTPAYWIIALCATFLVYFFNIQNKYVEKIIIIFDAMGLAFFTVVGVKVGIQSGLLNYQCVLMGVITACFGGITRDVIVNRVPYVFQNEIYGGFALLGGILYFFLRSYMSEGIPDLIVIPIIFAARMISVWKKWHLPRAGEVSIRKRKFPMTRKPNQRINI
ncbi:trimeric intracellular cation channel family protein [Fluviispira multicolorata]|uniref:Trimeric intracellular cation channel family protein n=1 Tax=Fluviispira multicolorata TaxID=2654512 RepID=A0A833JGA2_9BACT|nr:trimeric intracellular cation channel family protein [Fluviispira multicolorata]KAB8032036.1 trimeric intracellular cation channel family protein [Fluviispira multicolorata]